MAADPPPLDLLDNLLDKSGVSKTSSVVVHTGWLAPDAHG